MHEVKATATIAIHYSCAKKVGAQNASGQGAP